MIRYYSHRYSDITFRQLARHFFGRRVNVNCKDDFNGINRPCVFFLSTGRVGTKTIAALASLSEHIIGFHEPKPKLYGLSNICYKTFDEDKNLEIYKEAFLTARRDLFHYTLSFGKGYIETSPQVTFLSPIIHSVIPEAKFVHVIRDPRNFIRSGMRRRWYVDHPMDETRIKPPSNSKLNDEWQNWSPYRKIIWLWQETNLWIDKFINALGHKKRLFLHAEEIFEPQFDSIEKLYHFLNSSMPSKKKIKTILSKKMNAQTSGDFPKFGDWTNDMYTELIENAGKTAEYFGYRI
jgi:hypothetical protein